MWWTLCLSGVSYHNWTPYEEKLMPNTHYQPHISLARCILMVWEVRLANLIKTPTLKLCKSRSVVSYLPPWTHHEDWGILKQEPCPQCNYFQGVLAVSWQIWLHLQSLCRHGNSSPEGKTDHKQACLICPLTASLQGHILSFSTAVALLVILVD